MNLLAKNKLKKSLNEMIKNNDSINDFLLSMAKKYNYNEKEVKTINDINTHLSNSSQVFNQMLESIKLKK